MIGQLANFLFEKHKSRSGSITPNYTNRGFLPAASRAKAVLIKRRADMKAKNRNLLLPLRGEPSTGKLKSRRRRREAREEWTWQLAFREHFSADRSHLAWVKGRKWDEQGVDIGDGNMLKGGKGKRGWKSCGGRFMSYNLIWYCEIKSAFLLKEKQANK